MSDYNRQMSFMKILFTCENITINELRIYCAIMQDHCNSIQQYRKAGATCVNVLKDQNGCTNDPLAAW